MAKTNSTSWLSTDTSREALFDEIVKIGEAADKDRKDLKNAIKHIAAGSAGVGAGAAAGYGAVHLLEKGFPGHVIPRKPVKLGPRKKMFLTKGIPIAAGVGATLWARHRQKMQESLHGKPKDGGR